MANDLTAGERILKRVRQPANAGVAKFREGMKTMGMIQISLFVPADDKEEVLLAADKVRGYYMVQLCELPVEDRRRQVLADRNFFTIPTYERVKELETKLATLPLPLSGELKALKEHVGKSMSARGGLQYATTNEEAWKFSSLAVAHSAVAKYYYDKIMWEISQL